MMAITHFTRSLPMAKRFMMVAPVSVTAVEITVPQI